MSITTSREERDQAAERLAARTDEQLRDELAYWAVAVADHHDEWVALTEKRLGVGELHSEAQAWVNLVTETLQARRTKARAREGGS